MVKSLALLLAVDSHRLLGHLVAIASDFGHTFTIDGNLTFINPLPQDVCRSFVLTCLLTHDVELGLKVLNEVTLFLNL